MIEFNNVPEKKLVIFYILKILHEYTDSQHTMTQKQLLDKLKSVYGITVDRKTVRHNIDALCDLGYDIRCGKSEADTAENKKSGRASAAQTDLYLNHDISDGELRLLIDSLLFSAHLSNAQRRSLIKKLEALSNRYFKAKVRHVHCLPQSTLQSTDVIHTVGILDDAISKGRQVTFNYCYYGSDLRLHPQMGDNGAPKEYLINPYQMAAYNGRYYLICNYDKYSDIANYRIDRIANIRLLDTPVKPIRSISEVKDGFDLSKYMEENLYMFSGGKERVSFRADKKIIPDILDWFGKDTAILDHSDSEVTVTVKASPRSMKFWAMQYLPFVRVLQPQTLVDEIAEDLRRGVNKYSSN